MENFHLELLHYRLLKLDPTDLIPVLERGIEMMQLSALTQPEGTLTDQYRHARVLLCFIQTRRLGLTTDATFIKELDLIEPGAAMAALEEGLDVSRLLDWDADLQIQIDSATELKSFYQSKSNHQTF